MNFLKKGPELKLSEIRVPGFLLDLYYDLKDRHLLPLVVILLVAIVAVPIVLSESSDSEPAPGAGPGSTGAGFVEVAESNARNLVARAAPGLRDYRRRLDERAKNPFKQQYSAEKGASESTTPGSETSESSGSAEVPATEPAGSPETVPSESGGDNPEDNLTYFSYAIDVRVSAGGGQEDSESGKKVRVRRNLPELTMLPSRETPALVYMGSTRDGKKALMLVSSNVQGIFGDAKCVLGSETCELLALETGLPETVVYGGSGRTYKIELLKIHLVTTDELNRAPLGKPKQAPGKPHPHPAG